MVSFGRLGRKALGLIDWYIIGWESLGFVLALRVRRTEGLREFTDGSGSSIISCFVSCFYGGCECVKRKKEGEGFFDSVALYP